MRGFAVSVKSHRMGLMTPVEQIKDRLNIVDVVSTYVKLDPAGKNYKGKSPFTNERTPSFFVAPDKGLYHCFSTGKGGDIFTFIQEMEGLDFKGALRVLAERAGVKLGPVDVKAADQKERLYEITEKATEMFEAGLANSEEAKQYLRDRGVEDHVIKDFRIGYVPAGWRYLYEELSKKFSDADILLAGLGKKTDKGIYDTFRDRIMFPITDTAGRPIGFSGRILHADEKSAKYVNSPDTPLFNKSDILFGLDKAKNFIRKYNFTILVEGQFDVVMMHQAGFRNTVGVSGTALADNLGGANGVNNLGLVKRLSNNLILAFDADGAGIKAAKRSAHIGLKLGMDVKVVSIPGAKDPADFIKESGKDGWGAVLREAKHIIEFETEKIKESAKDERSMGNSIRAEVLPEIAMLGSEIEKSYFVKKVSDMTGIDQAVLWKDLEKINIPESQQLAVEQKAKSDSNRTTVIERKIMGIYFAKPDEKSITESLSKIMTKDRLAELVAKFEPVKQELIFESEMTTEDVAEGATLAEMLKNLEEDYLATNLDAVKIRLKKAETDANDAEAHKLSIEYQDLAKRLGEIKNSRHLHKF
jgi:DNA primase